MLSAPLWSILFTASTYFRMERKVRLQSIGRHRSPSQSHIKSLALGIGEYDSDSDYSLSDHAIHKKRHLYATQR